MQQLTAELLREFASDPDDIMWVHRDHRAQHDCDSRNCWCRPMALTWEEIHLTPIQDLQARIDAFMSQA